MGILKATRGRVVVLTATPLHFKVCTFLFQVKEILPALVSALKPLAAYPTREGIGAIPPLFRKKKGGSQYPVFPTSC